LRKEERPVPLLAKKEFLDVVMGGDVGESGGEGALCAKRKEGGRGGRTSHIPSKKGNPRLLEVGGNRGGGGKKRFYSTRGKIKKKEGESAQ